MCFSRGPIWVAILGSEIKLSPRDQNIPIDHSGPKPAITPAGKPTTLGGAFRVTFAGPCCAGGGEGEDLDRGGGRGGEILARSSAPPPPRKDQGQICKGKKETNPRAARARFYAGSRRKEEGGDVTERDGRGGPRSTVGDGMLR
jgi:hypothetical protein